MPRPIIQQIASRNNMFAETVLRQLIELLHGGKILSETRGLRGAAELHLWLSCITSPPAAASLMRPLESWMRAWAGPLNLSMSGSNQHVCPSSEILRQEAS
jgi:hypothetical protein